MSDLVERLDSANDEFDENMEFALKGLMGQAANALRARNKEIEALRAERDHYLSSWEESRKYLAIETHHAKQAEAHSEEAATALTAKDKEIEAVREERDAWRAAYMLSYEQCVARGSRAETAERERDELQQVFDFRWKADQRAIKAWQAAHPDRSSTWPDHTDMVVWLLGAMDEARAALKPLISICERHIYPQPDKPESDWAKVLAARAVIEQGE